MKYFIELVRSHFPILISLPYFPDSRSTLKLERSNLLQNKPRMCFRATNEPLKHPTCGLVRSWKSLKVLMKCDTFVCISHITRCLKWSRLKQFMQLKIYNIRMVYLAFYVFLALSPLRYLPIGLFIMSLLFSKTDASQKFLKFHVCFLMS